MTCPFLYHENFPWEPAHVSEQGGSTSFVPKRRQGNSENQRTCSLLELPPGKGIWKMRTPGDVNTKKQGARSTWAYQKHVKAWAHGQLLQQSTAHIHYTDRTDILETSSHRISDDEEPFIWVSDSSIGRPGVNEPMTRCVTCHRCTCLLSPELTYSTSRRYDNLPPNHALRLEHIEIADLVDGQQ